MAALFIFFYIRSSQERQILSGLTYDFVIIFISPVPLYLTLKTPIFLSQKVFLSVSSCSNPTKSPLVSSEVIQNIPRKCFTSGDGQNIKVCCYDGASQKENDQEGMKSARCQAKAWNCYYQFYSWQVVGVKVKRMNSVTVAVSVGNLVIERGCILLYQIQIVAYMDFSYNLQLINICRQVLMPFSPSFYMIFYLFQAIISFTHRKLIINRIQFMSVSALPTATSLSSQEQMPVTKRPLKTRGLQGSTEIWLREMAERDMSLWGLDKPLWICDNKIYDLTEFAEKHPGGRSWIDMTRGHDVTLSFKTHHLQENKVREVLNKYYVGEAKIKHEPRFDTKETGHYQEIRKRILGKFSTAELQDSTSTDIVCYSFVFVWFILVALASYFHSYIAAFGCGYLMAAFYGVGHIYIHRKDKMNILKHVYLLIGFSAREQRIMHVISHHPYINTAIDYEYAALEPIMNYSRYLPQNKWYLTIILQLLLAIVAPANVLTKVLVAPLIHKERPSFQHLILFLEIGYIYLFAGNIILALKLWGVMIIVAGIIMSKTITCPHRQIQLWSEGAPQIRDFVLHAIATTTEGNHEKISPIMALLLYSGFQIHAFHHLFPTIDHSKLYECNKIFTQYLQEKGMKVQMASKFECHKNMYKLEVGRKQFDIKLFLTE